MKLGDEPGDPSLAQEPRACCRNQTEIVQCRRPDVERELTHLAECAVDEPCGIVDLDRDDSRAVRFALDEVEVEPDRRQRLTDYIV